MLGNLIGRLFDFFTMLFGVFQAFIAWGANHLWVLVLSIVSPALGLFWAVWDWFSLAIKDWAVDLTRAEGSLDSFGDCVNAILTQSIYSAGGNGTVSEMFSDLVGVLNFGAFAQYLMTITFPVAIIVLVYRFVKSWIPSVAGS